MSQWAYITDLNDDLVNLHLMETIQLQGRAPLGAADPNDHQVVAVPPNSEDGYVLFEGTQEECLNFLKPIKLALVLNK